MRAVAPVSAVRGNNDLEEWAGPIPQMRRLTIGGWKIFLVHEARHVPDPPRCDLVVVGHSHVPRIERVDGVLWINPGSAGPRRFRLPVTLARLTIGKELQAEIIQLLP